ncbi:putative G-protein coupled receptor 160 [Fundulus diaphanus]
MLPVTLLSLENGQGVKMFAVVEQWDEASDRHTDNTNKYFMLLLIKLGLEAGVFYSCGTKKYTYVLSVCSLSVLLADFVLTFLMGAAWFLGAEKSLVSPCALLANASTTYGALPLPMMLLGFVDYCLEDIFMSDRPAFWKTLRNVLLTLVVWALAVNYSLHSSYIGPVELDSVGEKRALACEVRESALITVFTLGLFTATLLTLVPFLTRIPRWIREAHKLTEAREEQKNMGSDLLFTSSWNHDLQTKSQLEEHLEENGPARPPLWFSMMLGFLLFWMPYLLMSVSCLIFGLGIPAYLSVNLLWLECSNSFLVGLVFWAKSSTRGPYSSLPDNVCLWQVYWHLSRDIQQSLLPVSMFIPPYEKKNILHV